MSFDSEKRVAAHMLSVVEDGRHSVDDMKRFYEDADPALVHLLFSWLRHRYHAGHSASEGVLGRIVELCASSAAIAKKAKTGASDPIVEWFEEDHEYGDFDGPAFIDLIVEKLEG